MLVLSRTILAWRSCCRVAVFLLGGCLLVLCPAPSLADPPSQVDLSGSASMTPPDFVPGGQATFTMTIHNAGPDAAGTTGIGGIRVYGNQYIVTSKPPPFELVGPAVGNCFFERAVTEPLPDGNIALIFIFFFGAIPAGESRSCTTGVYFYPSTRTSVPTTWSLYSLPNNNDTNPENDNIDFVFHRRHVAVPGPSPLALLILGFALLLTAGYTFGSRRR